MPRPIQLDIHLMQSCLEILQTELVRGIDQRAPVLSIHKNPHQGAAIMGNPQNTRACLQRQMVCDVSAIKGKTLGDPISKGKGSNRRELHPIC